MKILGEKVMVSMKMKIMLLHSKYPSCVALKPREFWRLQICVLK